MKHKNAFAGAWHLGKSLVSDPVGTLRDVFKGATEGGDHIAGKWSNPIIGGLGVAFTTVGLGSFNLPLAAIGLYMAGDAGDRYLEAGRALSGPAAQPAG